ncbi:hypothetical protein QBC37DRAFT_380223 [Rhypophila decipiens]|uniref:Uncharacterized protein n=1 Tax=Rhypophila decipiens TaxID=261697 RepID=A0AAN7B1C4_9PEZI|nr:hypothetical protein QBC37DRAFT_380223 [Rhypophila decipiens]
MAMDRPWHGLSHPVTAQSRRPWARPEDLAKLPPIAQGRIDFHFEEGERLEREQEQMPPPPASTASTQGQSGNDFYAPQGATAEYGSTYGAMSQYNTPSQYGSAGHDAYGSASYSTLSPSTGQTGYSGYSSYTASAPQAGYTTQQAYSTTPAAYSATQHEYSTTEPNYSTPQQGYDTSAGYDASSASADYTQPQAQYYEYPDPQTQSQSQPTEVAEDTSFQNPASMVPGTTGYVSRPSYRERTQREEEQEQEEEDDQYFPAGSKRRYESTPSTGDSYGAESPEPSRSHRQSKDGSKSRHKKKHTRR